MATPEQLLYLDTSAAAKLIFDEGGSVVLREALAARTTLVSSELLLAELPRAVNRRSIGRRAQEQQALRRALALTVERFDLVPLDRAALVAAGDLAGAWMRSLDAIHVVAALSLGEAVDAFVTYDQRQAEAAEAHGFTVLAPGPA